MWKKRFVICLLLWVSLLLLGSVGTCSASQTYQISETQLETLQSHLSALEQNNNELLTLLDESNLDLSEASKALSESRQELMTLREQLVALQAETKQLDESLKIANAELQSARESFKKSEREHDRIEGRLRTQRNIWEVLFAVAVGVAASR